MLRQLQTNDVHDLSKLLLTRPRTTIHTPRIQSAEVFLPLSILQIVASIPTINKLSEITFMFLNKFSAEQMFQINARTNRAPESIGQYTGKIISAVEVASSH